jgi:hypothetical protein
MVWYQIIGDTVRCLIVVHPVLSSLNSFFELLSFLTKFSCSRIWILYEVSKLTLWLWRCLIVSTFIFIKLIFFLLRLLLLLFSSIVKGLSKVLHRNSIIQTIHDILFELMLSRAMGPLIKWIWLLEKAWIGFPGILILIFVDFLNFLICWFSWLELREQVTFLSSGPLTSILWLLLIGHLNLSIIILSL